MFRSIVLCAATLCLTANLEAQNFSPTVRVDQSGGRHVYAKHSFTSAHIKTVDTNNVQIGFVIDPGIVSPTYNVFTEIRRDYPSMNGTYKALDLFAGQTSSSWHLLWTYNDSSLYISSTSDMGLKWNSSLIATTTSSIYAAAGACNQYGDMRAIALTRSGPNSTRKYLAKLHNQASWSTIMEQGHQSEYGLGIVCDAEATTEGFYLFYSTDWDQSAEVQGSNFPYSTHYNYASTATISGTDFTITTGDIVDTFESGPNIFAAVAPNLTSCTLGTCNFSSPWNSYTTGTLFAFTSVTNNPDPPYGYNTPFRIFSCGPTGATSLYTPWTQTAPLPVGHSWSNNFSLHRSPQDGKVYVPYLFTRSSYTGNEVGILDVGANTYSFAFNDYNSDDSNYQTPVMQSLRSTPQMSIRSSADKYTSNGTTPQIHTTNGYKPVGANTYDTAYVPPLDTIEEDYFTWNGVDLTTDPEFSSLCSSLGVGSHKGTWLKIEDIGSYQPYHFKYSNPNPQFGYEGGALVFYREIGNDPVFFTSRTFEYGDPNWFIEVDPDAGVDVLIFLYSSTYTGLQPVYIEVK